jgi:adenylate kinase
MDSPSPKQPFGRYQAFLILGAPGSGKGTVGRILGAIPRFIHFACGDAFRSLDTRSEIGRKFVEYSMHGQLVPDELTIQLWESQIHARVETSVYKPDIDFLVLDGIPRNVEQARMLDDHVDIIQVFHLSCPDREELARRIRKRALKENRFDDASEEVIRRRFATYEEETKPILEYYGVDKVLDVDASQPPARVLLEILLRITQLRVWKEREGIRV